MPRSTPSSGTSRRSVQVQVLVMAKQPEPGLVKTRLAAAIGAAAAADLSRAFIADLAVRLAGAGFRVTWAVWPPGAAFAEVLPGADWMAQEGLDLGDRMRAAAGKVLARDPAPVLILGADVPHVPIEALGEGGAVLTTGTDADVVLGPALDGGYYLLGFRSVVPALFEGIPWGTAQVLSATLRRSRDLGLRVHLLAPTFDVDGPADLIALRALVDRGEVALPRTADVLGTLPIGVS